MTPLYCQRKQEYLTFCVRVRARLWLEVLRSAFLQITAPGNKLPVTCCYGSLLPNQADLEHKAPKNQRFVDCLSRWQAPEVRDAVTDWGCRSPHSYPGRCGCLSGAVSILKWQHLPVAFIRETLFQHCLSATIWRWWQVQHQHPQVQLLEPGHPDTSWTEIFGDSRWIPERTDPDPEEAAAGKYKEIPQAHPFHKQMML